MICPPCANAADTIPAEVEALAGTFLPGDPIVYEPPRSKTHPPDICRDAAIQPHGCACRHGHDGPNAHQTTTRTREAQHA